jgi:hypothetical protein
MPSRERDEDNTETGVPPATPRDSEKPRGSDRGPRREPRSPKH